MSRNPQRLSDLSDLSAPCAPIGPAYEAEKTLKRLKYLDGILNSPNVCRESIREAQHEKTQIMDAIPD